MKTKQTLLLPVILLLITGTALSMDKDEKDMGAIGLGLAVMKIEKDHENAWKELMSNYKTRKSNLVMSHNNERHNLEKEMFEEINKQGFSDELYLKYIKNFLELDIKQHKEWRKLWDDKKKAVKELDEKQMKNLENLKKMLPAAAPAA